MSESDQWELLSNASTASPFHITSPIKTVDKNIKNNDNDDNISIQSSQSLQSASTTPTSSTDFVANSPINTTTSLIPQINENIQLNINNNELIPSYIDIQSELQQQRQLINELKTQLQDVTQQRDQIRQERDVLQVRVSNDNMEISRLRQVNLEIDQQNIMFRQMKRKDRRRKLKKIQSKTDASLTNRRGHRTSVPAKLRFRRQRTTHRSVYVQGRRW